MRMSSVFDKPIGGATIIFPEGETRWFLARVSRIDREKFAVFCRCQMGSASERAVAARRAICPRTYIARACQKLQEFGFPAVVEESRTRGASSRDRPSRYPTIPRIVALRARLARPLSARRRGLRDELSEATNIIFALTMARRDLSTRADAPSRPTEETSARGCNNFHRVIRDSLRNLSAAAKRPARYLRTFHFRVRA